MEKYGDTATYFVTTCTSIKYQVIIVPSTSKK